MSGGMASCLASPFDYELDGDIIVHGIFPDYKCWRPNPQLPLPRSLKNYKPLTHVASVLHFHDFIEVSNKKAIIPSPIRNDFHSILPTGFNGSWFVVSSPCDEYNGHGNVSCQIGFQDLLNEFSPRCYFVEIVQYKTVSYPRLLLTTQDVSRDINVIKYSPYLYGGPWFRDESGENYFLEAGRLHKRNLAQNPYELEFVLVLSKQECKKLYEMCDTEPVNHKGAKDREIHKCKKHSSGSGKEACPTPWSKKKCREKLNRLMIDYRDKDNDTDKSDDDHGWDF